MPEIEAAPAVNSGTATSETIAIEDDAVETGPAKSDEELVGLEPDAYRAEYKEPNDQKTQEDNPQAAKDEKDVPSDEEEIAAGQPFPESFKKAIAANPEIKPELQRLWDQHQAFREIFPTVAEARAVRELFPGGAADAKAVLSKAREMEQSDQLFFSRDPYAQRELAANMLAMDPQAFGAMLKVSSDLVREKQPELYQAFTSGLATQALAGEGFHEHLGMIAQALENNDLHSLQRLASQLVQWVSGNGGSTGQRPPLAEAKTQREQMLERELNSLTLQQSATFSDSINRTVIPQIDGEIHKLIEPVAKGLPAYAREGAVQSLADQIHAGIQQRLKSDNYYYNQVIPLHTSMNYGAQNREVASKIIVSRALLHLKPVVAGSKNQIFLISAYSFDA